MTACAKCQHDPDAAVIARWEFTIPRDLPSLNERIHNGAKGWKYRATRDAWAADLRAIRFANRIPHIGASPPTTRRRVTLVRVYSGRQKEMDRANLDSKACVDAMIISGLIVDDSPSWLELHVLQERGTERGTRVLIEELSQ